MRGDLDLSRPAGPDCVRRMSMQQFAIAGFGEFEVGTFNMDTQHFGYEMKAWS